ncbi:MAG TPA: glycosyltransferase [Solirubrobacteraceae bacterium]
MSEPTDPPVDTAERAVAGRFAEAARRVQQLESQAQQRDLEVEALRAQIAAPNPELEQLRARLKRVDESVIWRGTQTLKRAAYGPAGDQSRRARVISAVLRGAARVALPARPVDEDAPAGSAAVEPAPVVVPPIAEVPQFGAPEVSLVLPVHSQPELTAACVRAIVATATVPYELIIVDDTASAPVKDVVRRIDGAMVTVNERNLGYTRSLNRGAGLARGRFLIFLNDDIVPQAGWLEAMVGCARSSGEVGVVVPMYLDPAGCLKEAGSIIWRDGSADNFGRGDPDRERSRYRYRREVDYGSGACLLIRADLFQEIGGLDERFSPAYYEDVDLCFAVREAGGRVVYEPRARVVHVEGGTAGSDVASGTKRFQVINQDVFVEKWRHRLGQQPHRGGDMRVASRRSAGPQVLIVEERVPSPDRDGGSRRIWRLIEAFRGLGCAVTLLPAGGDVAEPYASRLETAGVEVLRRPLDVEPEIAAMGPVLALAVLCRPVVASQYVYLLRALAPAARIAYDTVDLHFVRELRRSAIEGVPAGGRVDALREIELAMVRCCDTTIVVTDEEREEVLRSVPGAAVQVIPTIEEPIADHPDPDGRSGIVFVGNFLHAPNVDAARFLVDSVMPHVWQQLGDVQLRLVGQDPPAQVQALAGPRVEVTGWLEDLTPVFAGARVSVAPLRYGAGLKIKSVEAMAHGVPVVSTAVGAEGMLIAAGEHLLIADEPHDFARQIVALLQDDGLWRRTSDAGRAFVRERYAPDVIIPQLRALLAEQQVAPASEIPRP